MPNTKQLIEYMQWADSIICEILKTLSEDQLTKGFDNARSINFRLRHLAEEHIAWYHDVIGQSWKAAVDKIQEYNASQYIEVISEYHQLWKSLQDSISDDEIIQIQEGNGLVVSIPFSEVIFNLINHTTYHRGQIVTLLRLLDKSTPITDFYWYKIHLLE